MLDGRDGHWTNWSGSVQAQPDQFHAPHTEEELIAQVRGHLRTLSYAEASIRVAGSGHSFVPLCATDGLLLSLDNILGVIAADTEQQTAVVRAGTKLYNLGPLLHQHGLAMQNLGDIDRQSLAGAVSTGTHGTGPTLGNISSQVIGLRLLTGQGEIVASTPQQEPELFRAAQVSVGALGILLDITLRLLPAYRLHERTWILPYDECVAKTPELIAANRHFEFFWSPQEDACAVKTLNPTEATELAHSDPPSAPGRLSRYLNPERIDWSYRILPSERNVRFNEMEYAVPAEQGLECLHEIRHMMQTHHPDVVWPLEYRTVAADDSYLSPARGRATVTISVHQAADLPHKALFADAEAIFHNHHGRPHWGKCHTCTATQLRDLYPCWEKFQTLRCQYDPQARLLNPYLRELFEI